MATRNPGAGRGRGVARGSAQLRRVFAVLLLVLSDVLLVETGVLGAAVALAATAAVGSALVLCAVHAARSVPRVPLARIRTALRERAMRTAFLPQRDPDAAGRRRPRAPGRAFVTAAACR